VLLVAGGCHLLSGLSDYDVAPAAGGAGPGGSSGGGQGGDGGSGGNGGSGGAIADGAVGAPCASDRDCDAAQGLLCITEAGDFSGSAGPRIANGVCTRACAPPNLGCPEGSFCTGEVCVEACIFGAPMAQKCHDRLDMACFSKLAFGVIAKTELPNDLCLPRCNADSDCDETAGLCDWRTGLCTSELSSEGLGVTEACVVEAGSGGEGGAASNPCATGSCYGGVCGNTGCCVETCTFGAPGACAGNTNRCVMPLAGSLGNDGSLFGDAALCAIRCSCNADCEPGTKCNLQDGDERFCGQPELGRGVEMCD